MAWSVTRWALFGTGPFATQINSCNIVVRTLPTLAQPDVQLMCNPVRMDARMWFPGVGKRQEHRITADAVVLHPQSRGHLTLSCADPQAPPRISLNLFSEAADMDTAQRGVALARMIYRPSRRRGLRAAKSVRVPTSIPVRSWWPTFARMQV